MNSQSRIVCGKCWSVRLLSAGATGDCCEGATYMAIADGRGRDIGDVFAEVEQTDRMVSQVELDTEDLERFQQTHKGQVDHYGDGGAMLWGATIRILDGKLVVWDERSGKEQDF
jgi:hypothetical protein